MPNYKDTLSALNELIGKNQIKWELDPTKNVLRALNHPQSHYPTVHIAGTNGKGTVATKIAKTLELAGYKTALYTSPHICSVRERIQINGQPIPESDFTQIFEQINQMEQIRRQPLSFFEMLTCMAFTWFADQKVDVGVIETGLGGRLDSTNVIHPCLSIITSIGLDHTEILGKSVEEIAVEKAGILKYDTPVIIGPSIPVATLSPIAQKLNTPLYPLQRTFLDPTEENREIAHLACTLLQKHFFLEPHIIQQGLQANPPARRQKIHVPSHPDLNIIIDIAHNPIALKKLVQSLHLSPESAHFVFGLSKDKAIDQCIAPLLPFAKSLQLIQTEHCRSCPSKTLYEIAMSSTKNSSISIQYHQNPEDGFQQAIRLANPRQPVVLCGSVYPIENILKFLSISYLSDPFPLSDPIKSGKTVVNP